MASSFFLHRVIVIAQQHADSFARIPSSRTCGLRVKTMSVLGLQGCPPTGAPARPATCLTRALTSLRPDGGKPVTTGQTPIRQRAILPLAGDTPVKDWTKSHAPHCSGTTCRAR